MSLLALLLIAADIPESQLVTQVGDREVFAPAFRGVWSKSAATCRDEHSSETFAVSETRLDGYEWDAALLKTTPIIHQSGPEADEPVYTVLVLTAARGETDVDIGKTRLSLAGDKLYMSSADAVSEEDHLSEQYANVRCR